jgi:hypothetical protein
MDGLICFWVVVRIVLARSGWAITAWHPG